MSFYISEGFVGYKVLKTPDRNIFYICELYIPEGNLCYEDKKGKQRTNSAQVLKIHKTKGVWDFGYRKILKFLKNDLDTVHHIGIGMGRKLKYKVGEIVLPHMFSLENEKCAPGIHYFKSIKELFKHFDLK